MEANALVDCFHAQRLLHQLAAVVTVLEDRHRDDNVNNGGGNVGGAGFSDADQAARDLDNRPIDYGAGGSDWGGDAGGGGGGSDSFGGGGSDDGGGW